MFFKQEDIVDEIARGELRYLRQEVEALSAFVKEHMKEEEKDRGNFIGRLEQIEKKQIYLGIAIAILLQESFTGLPVVDLIALLVK